MIKKLGLATAVSALLLSGCGGGGGNNKATSTQTTIQNETINNSLSKFFNIQITRDEWNNVEGSTFNKALGSGDVRIYYNPTESNKTMELTETYFKQDNTQAEFFQRIVNYQQQNTYKNAFVWHAIEKDDNSVFAKTTYTEVESVINNDTQKNEVVDIKYVEYLKFVLKGKKLYTLSLKYKEAFEGDLKIKKWTDILGNATAETIKYTPVQIPRCIIDGDTIIGTEGKTCSDNSENTLTCSQTRPTLNGTFTAGPGKSIKINGKEYSCQ